MTEAMKHIGLRLVVSITDQASAKRVNQLMNQARFSVRYRFWGEGTASNEMLDYLGLAKSEKVVLICTAPKSLAPKFLDILRRELSLEQPGHGMAFSIPISGASNPLARMVNTDMFAEKIEPTKLEKRVHEHVVKRVQTKMDKEVNQMSECVTHSLIMAAVNQGYSESVMEAATAAGARGGTVIHARRLGLEESMQLWGISLQEERELVAILVHKEDKMAIMKAIGETCGAHSPAKGLVFSMPVDGIQGID